MRHPKNQKKDSLKSQLVCYTESKSGSRRPRNSPRCPQGMCLCWRSHHRTWPHRRSVTSQQSPCSCNTGCSDASWWQSAPRRCPSHQPWTSKEVREKDERIRGEKERTENKIYLFRKQSDLVMIYFLNFLKTFYWGTLSNLKAARVWMVQKHPYPIWSFTQIHLLFTYCY